MKNGKWEKKVEQEQKRAKKEKEWEREIET